MTLRRFSSGGSNRVIRAGRRFGVAAVIDGDRGTLGSQQLADPATDASAASGDQCNAPIDLTHLCSL
jgi:hypothetical protein